MSSRFALGWDRLSACQAFGRSGVAFGLCLGVWLTAPTPAPSAESHEERGKRVIHEALEALGGQAFLDMEDRVETGRAYSFYREQLTGLSVARIYTRYLVPVPGKIALRERQAFGKDQSSAVLFADDGAWEITARAPARAWIAALFSGRGRF